MAYVLMTSLLYPAVLGTLFYNLLDDFSNIGQGLGKIIYVLASIGVVMHFSFDYVYTYASKHVYTYKLFVSDLVVLFCLFLSYKSLTDGLKSSGNIQVFYLGFIVMHCIFVLWDTVFVPKNSRVTRLIVYDLIGLLLSLIGFFVFSSQAIAGVITLWLIILTFIILGLKEIVRLLETHDAK